jgi:enoyl-CoA hydratase/carnithine racemase
VYETLLTSADRGVATIVLNRPERMNAWTPRMGLELRHAIAGYDADDEIRAIVVTGAGRAFCAGADLEAGADTFSRLDRDERARLAEQLRPTHDRPYWEMRTPIIAAMNGPAVGVGMTMVMQWDLRVMAEDAKYGFVFNRRGVLPELGSHWLLPRLVGAARAFELLVTGRILTGAEAVAIGLANAAVPAGEVLERATALARDIADNVAPVSAALSKNLLYRFLEEDDREAAARLEEELFGWTTRQADAREGPVAFLEKRPPRWALAKNRDFPSELLERPLGSPAVRPQAG